MTMCTELDGMLPLSPFSHLCHKLLLFQYLPHSTARGFECGTALTFVCPTDKGRLREVEERLRGDSGKKLPQGRSKCKITLIKANWCKLTWIVLH